MDLYQHTIFPSYLAVAGIVKYIISDRLMTSDVTQASVVSGVCEGLSNLPTDTVTGYGALQVVPQANSTIEFSSILLSFILNR